MSTPSASALRAHAHVYSIQPRASLRARLDAAASDASTVATTNHTHTAVAPTKRARVMVDTAERRRFSQVSHEYLIEQLQWSGKRFTAPIENGKRITENANKVEKI